jgi:hypothetical protein
MARKSNFDSVGPAEQAAQEAIKAERPIKSNREKYQKVFILNAEQNDQLRDYCHFAKVSIQEVVIEGLNMVLRSKGQREL